MLKVGGVLKPGVLPPRIKSREFVPGGSKYSCVNRAAIYRVFVEGSFREDAIIYQDIFNIKNNRFS